MDSIELKKVLNLHKLWLVDETDGQRADLSEANLRGANLRGADLFGANLRGANLFGADLYEANLRGADLFGANLRGANLSWANLSWANLYEANLRGADLFGADLSWANLRGANLFGANLFGADLFEADLFEADLFEANIPSPTMILFAQWGVCSPELTLDLMRFDASNHPNPDKFVEWANGGPCPYEGEKIQRAANFKEVRELYSPGPAPSAYQIMTQLIAEKCKNS